MITNREVFEDHFLPQRLEHRNEEAKELVRAFEPAMEGTAPREILIHGPSGVGKTVLARHTLDKLERQADVDHAFVRCLGKSTAGILRAILEDLGASPATNTPTERLHEQLRERVESPVIVVLDEADGLPEKDALSTLGDVPVLAAVPICHDVDDWLARADGPVRQRFKSSTLLLERYSVTELTDILAKRAQSGLRRDAVDREQLERIADEVAGVARYGIQALLAAAELATERDHGSIQGEDVDDCFRRARHHIRKSNLESLPFHHHVIYEFVRRGGPIRAEILHDRYEMRASEIYDGHGATPLSRRGRRNKLQKLREYDLIEARGEGKAREYLPVDESLSSEFDIGPIFSAA